jgi:hypothetical protein
MAYLMQTQGLQSILKEEMKKMEINLIKRLQTPD